MSIVEKLPLLLNLKYAVRRYIDYFKLPILFFPIWGRIGFNIYGMTKKINEG